MAATVVSLYIDMLEDQIKNRSDNLSGGGARDFAEYRYQCGYISALKFSENELKDLIRRSSNED